MRRHQVQACKFVLSLCLVSLLLHVFLSFGRAPQEWDPGPLPGANRRNTSAEEVFRFSKLGRIVLGLDEEEEEGASPEHGERYTIGVWRHGERLKRRLVQNYGGVDKDVFDGCRHRNCRLVYLDETSDSDFGGIHALLVHLHLTKNPNTLPKTRHPHTRWIFLTDESPFNTFLANKSLKMADFNGVFNWSMGYRMDMDVPVPYGVTLPLRQRNRDVDLVKILDSKTKSVAIMISNCGGRNARWKYLKELEKYIKIDVYGACGPLKCPGHFDKDCAVLSDYKFYLAFESSNCDQYMTEKLWWNAYGKNAVPVVMGSPKSDYQKFCPPNSFIHVEDFTSPRKLAEYLQYLDANDSAYLKLLEWKYQFEVLNEHGYFGAPNRHYCRICEALNVYDSTPKVYNKLEEFWNPDRDCHPSLPFT